MTITAAEERAMQRALTLAASPGVPLGPNPRVGCVLLDADGETVAEGFHRGVGTPHAEAAALAAAGPAARGTTAVVTLEPCNHTGRTGPCAEALIEAGVRRVVFAMSDPNPTADGGAERLRQAGIDVVAEIAEDAASELNRGWLHGLTHHRPWVTWKFATTLDGFSAASDGTSRWVSSAPARLDTHRLRAECDVVLVGTNTVEVDDPELTVRDETGRPALHQPLRAVMGERDLDPVRRVFNEVADTVHLRTRDPHEALRELFGLGRRRVFLEGGPSLAAAFLEAGLIDEVVVYLAPKLLGAGHRAVAELGITTITDAREFTITDATTIGTGEQTNLRLTMTPGKGN